MQPRLQSATAVLSCSCLLYTSILKGRKVNPNVRTIIIPATQEVYLQCIEEGLTKIFIQAGAIAVSYTHLSRLKAPLRIFSAKSVMYSALRKVMPSDCNRGTPAAAMLSAVTVPSASCCLLYTSRCV